MELTTLALLLLIPLLIWRTYSRLKLLFARQESFAWKHWTGAAGFPLLLLAAAWGMRQDPYAISLMGAGIMAGGWLAVFALKKTRFENAGGKLFFTPYARTGILVCMLFVARVVQIGVELYLNRQSEHPRAIPQAEVMHHPYTVISFGLMLGYLAIYSIGLLRWRAGQKT